MPQISTDQRVDVSFICYGMNGGIGTYILNMYKGLRERGKKVELVCVDYDRQYLVDPVPESDVHVLPSLDYRRGVACLGSYLEKAQPEVVITPHIRQTIVALRARAAARVGTRIYAVIHAAYSEDFRQLPFFKKLFRLIRLRYYYPKCDGIIAVSNGVARDLTRITRIPARKVSVLYNPATNGEIRIKASQSIDHPWFRKGQPPVIIGIGRLTDQKNFHVLIEAFEIVRKRIPSRLLILGEGPRRQILEHRAESSPFKNDISLPGHIDNPYPYLKQAALFVLSSNYEGLPTVLIEAMALGTQVVSTDCPHGPREILLDGKLAPLVPVNDGEAIAEAISVCLRQSRPTGDLVRASITFQAETVVENYINFLGLSH